MFLRKKRRQLSSGRKYRATVNACGYTLVNKELFELLTYVIDKNAFSTLGQNHPLEYMNLKRNWKALKG